MLRHDQNLQPDNILLPTSYFPPVAYYAFLAIGRPVLIEQHETYPKQTYRNRCEILTAAGRTSLTVPVTKPHGNRTLTRDIEICYREPWQRVHWRSLEAAYNSSPYYLYYAELLFHLFNNRQPSLIALNREIIEFINKIIGINPEMNFTADYERMPSVGRDFRKDLKPGKGPSNGLCPSYPQVFSHLHGFTANLSILDLLFNLGPETKGYLEKLASRLLP